MEYIKIRFGGNIGQLECDLEKSINDVFQTLSPIFRLSERSWRPAMDIYETPSEIVIMSELSGVDKKDLDIEINSRAVKIHGIRRPLPRVERMTYRLAEIQYGRFERILFLPAPIDPEKATASFVNGLLNIRLERISRERVCKVPISDE